MRITFGAQVCGDLDAGSQREWLVADGLGGFAMGTVTGLRTRRYHGLLVIGEPGEPARRRMALAALDAVLVLPGGAEVRLAVHEWGGGAVAPVGHTLLERFDLIDGVPRWRWRVGDVVVEREIATAYGAPAVSVVHRLLAGPDGTRLDLYPLCTWRDAHGERGAGEAQPAVAPADRGFTVDDSYRLVGEGWQAGPGEWWREVYAREEAARGLNAVEDLWQPGRFTVVLARGEAHEVRAWSGDLSTWPVAEDTVAARRQRARELTRDAADEVDATLRLAADAFVVDGGAGGGSRTGGGPEVVAGYPWFGAWSRDTMTAYEGLFLCTGRASEGRLLLERYAATISEGMLANTADTGTTEYNTVDAALWFLHAVDRHVAVTGDLDLGAALADPLAGIVEAYAAGTRYGISADPADGLIRQGAEGHALTWMDARIDGIPVTPRPGKPVEVNALWVNGLAALADMFDRLGRDASALRARHKTAADSFAARFPSPAGWLFDTVDPDDDSLRPNQLLAYALPHAPLTASPDTLRLLAPLVTPLGPRSLSPDGPGYRGVHRGDVVRRDLAYHEGTVWPWLQGSYVDVIMKDPVRSGTEARFLLAGIEAHLSEWGLGSVSETADGDAPHLATGCPFQAWSVAEVLRVRQKFQESFTSQK